MGIAHSSNKLVVAAGGVFFSPGGIVGILPGFKVKNALCTKLHCVIIALIILYTIAQRAFKALKQVCTMLQCIIEALNTHCEILQSIFKAVKHCCETS